MDYSTDLSVVDWLQIDEKRIYSNGPLRVADMLPNIFSTYTALLPAVGIIEGFPFKEVNVKNTSIAQLNRNAAVWKQYGLYNANQTPNYTPTRFIALANLFNLPYTLQLGEQLEWGKRGFAIQWEQTANDLKFLLKSITADRQLLMYVVDFERWAEIYQLLPTTTAAVFHVTVEDFTAFLEQTFFDATLYLFPSDRSWCLINVEDGLCPVIGAQAEVGALLYSLPFMEKLPLSSNSEL